MDAPKDNGKGKERPISRPLSSAPQPLDFRGPPYPPFRYNVPGPHPPPPLGTSYDIPTHTTEFRAIRPFRLYNYLESPGEDLSSRLYTLGRDNLWEFTSVYQPSAHWDPHEVWRPGGHDSHDSHDQPQLSVDVGMGHAESNHPPPHYQPPSPDIPLPSPVTPITPIAPVAGSSTGPGTARGSQQRRRRDSSASNSKEKKWFCETCKSEPFFRKAEYDRHMKTSNAHKKQRSSEPKFQCGKCGRSFTRSDARMRHEKLCNSKGKGRAHESEGSDN